MATPAPYQLFPDLADDDYAALKRSPKAPIPSWMRWQVWSRDDFRCVYCGAREWLSLDHVVAESAGGATAPENLVTACSPCNSRKAASEVLTFEARTEAVYVIGADVHALPDGRKLRLRDMSVSDLRSLVSMRRERLDEDRASLARLESVLTQAERMVG